MSDEVSDVEFEIASKAHSELDKHFTLSVDASIAAVHIAIKSLFLINGGSAVALLAFLNGNTNLTGSRPLEEFVEALMLFAIGVAAATVCAMMAYLVNYCNLKYLTNHEKTWKPPYTKINRKTKRWEIASDSFFLIGFLFSAICLVLYLFGVFKVSTALSGIS